MPIYNLLEYSQNYFMTSGRLCDYYRNEIDDVDNNASDGKSFEYKTKVIGKTAQSLPQPDPDEDGNQQLQPLVPVLNVEFTI